MATNKTIDLLTQTIRAILKHCTNECDEITASDCLDAIQETCFAALDAVDPEQKAAGTEIPAAHPACYGHYDGRNTHSGSTLTRLP